MIDGKRQGHRPSVIFGAVGTVFSALAIVVYMLPVLSSQSQLPTESYMILVLWSVLGVVVFRFLIQKDKSRRLGKSFIVWVILLILILLVSVIWVNKATVDKASVITEELQQTNQSYAQNAGFQADVAENGKVAVDMIAAANADEYSAVLMDIMMPVMDGFEATKSIRALGDSRAQIPIIAVSANTFASDKRKSIGAGMNAHIAKPYDPDELISTIIEIIQENGDA